MIALSLSPEHKLTIYNKLGMFTILKAVSTLPTPPKLVFVTAVGMGIKGRARLPFP